MATKEENKPETEESKEGREASHALATEARAVDGTENEEVSFDGAVPAQLGTTRYVHAAFFAAGVGVAFLSGKLLAALWNLLAEWPAAVQAVPQLLQLAEDERLTYTMLVGAVIGILSVIYAVRRPGIRQWADEVASELYKVHWPEREVVTNGTIVVIVAGVFATVYIGLLDRIWGFITNLVYGA